MANAVINIPIYVNPIRLTGINGMHLKFIKEKSGCQCVWTDFTNNVVEIWGKDDKLSKAIELVKSRITKLTKLFKPNEYYEASEDLQTSIDVYCWRFDIHVYYNITPASEQDFQKFFNIILKNYPYDSYTTRIKKRTSTSIIVIRDQIKI